MGTGTGMDTSGSMYGGGSQGYNPYGGYGMSSYGYNPYGGYGMGGYVNPFLGGYGGYGMGFSPYGAGGYGMNTGGMQQPQVAAAQPQQTQPQVQAGSGVSYIAPVQQRQTGVNDPDIFNSASLTKPNQYNPNPYQFRV